MGLLTYFKSGLWRADGVAQVELLPSMHEALGSLTSNVIWHPWPQLLGRLRQEGGVQNHPG